MPCLDLRVTRGDPFYYEIPFVDPTGAPMDMSAFSAQVDFKLNFNDRLPYFSLTQDTGLAFKNADPTTGILCLMIDPGQFDGLDLSVLPRNGERIPFKFVFGDVKLTPPDGFALVQDAGGRTTIILKVLAGVTA